ncbi:Nop14-like family-domain-containing protein [Pelagophyceae sp. CCMP2097]|nr:Nop14-like family-domain-containing protein [Pelagophyceae sp. CCMP2097]
MARGPKAKPAKRGNAKSSTRAVSKPSFGSRPSSASKSAPAGNPFDVLGNKRKGHGVLNARVKGAVRDVQRSRMRGAERRKVGLLGELARERNENEFEDQRLGESNRDLDAEEKMLLRFQKERTSKRQKYDLGDEEGLTHGGRDADDDDGTSNFFDDDAHGFHKRDTAHFGDGETDAKSGSKANADDFVNDMIEKTKNDRDERQMATAQISADIAKLDEGFGELSKLLDFRAATQKQRLQKDKDDGEDDDYGRTLRELAFERRAVASNPSRSVEETARVEFDQLARLEGERVRAIDNPSGLAPAVRDDGKDKKLSKYAQKKAAKADKKADQKDKRLESNTKSAVDDDPWLRAKSDPWYGIVKPRDDDDFSEDDDYAEPDAAVAVFAPKQKGAVAPKAAAAAAVEDDDSEGSSLDDDADFQEAMANPKVIAAFEDINSSGAPDAAKIKRYLADADVAPTLLKMLGADELDGSEDGSSDEGDVEAGGDEVEEEDEGQEEDDEDDNEDEQEEVDDDAEMEEDDASADASDAGAVQPLALHLPFVFLECPATVDELNALIGSVARSPTEAILVLERLRACHTPRLALRKRPLFEKFVDAMLQRLVQVGDALAQEDSHAAEVPGLCAQISLALRKDLPAGSSRTNESHAQPNKSAQAIWGRVVDAAWAGGSDKANILPSVGELLSLTLLQRECSFAEASAASAHVDRAARNQAAADSRESENAFYTLQYKALLVCCRALSRFDAALHAAQLPAALLCANVALELGRGCFVPEVHSFAARALALFAAGEPLANLAAKAPPASSKLDLVGCGDGAWLKSAARCAKVLHALCGFAAALATDASSDASSFVGGAAARRPLAAAPELHARLADTLRRAQGARGAAKEKVSPAKAAPSAVAAALARVEALSAYARLSRSALGWIAAASAAPKKELIKSLEPHLDRRLVVRKDAHLDRDHPAVQVKQLKKELKREHKGALRELRRDSEFLQAERSKQKAQSDGASQAQRQANHAWIQTQSQQDYTSTD